MFAVISLIYIGGRAIAVPSEVKGLYEAWRMFGNTPWRELIAPTIQLCREGIEISPSLERALHQYENVVREEPELR